MTNEFKPVSELFKQLPAECEKRIRAEAEQISAVIKFSSLRKRQVFLMEDIARNASNCDAYNSQQD